MVSKKVMSIWLQITN